VEMIGLPYGNIFSPRRKCTISRHLVEVEVPETLEKHTRESGSLVGRRVDWNKEGIERVEFLITPMKECEGCKRLEEKVRVLEEKDSWRDFLVLAGEAISRLLLNHLFPNLFGTEDVLMKGLNCWKDVGKVLRVSKEKHYRGACAEVERSERLQDLVYTVVEKKFGMTKEMWDAIQEQDVSQTWQASSCCR
jgi:hypothetical protein